MGKAMCTGRQAGELFMPDDKHIQTLLVATGNPGKFREIAAELEPLSIRCLSLKDLPPTAECHEEGSTFEENARQKATYYAQATGQTTLADDSGLEVDALGGAPGVRSARYAGQPCDDRANNRKLVQELAGVAPEKRAARFRCVMALADADGNILATTQGAIEGLIIDEARGQGGFGYDPHFLVPRLGKTTAELSQEEKNKISHRGQATRAMREAIRKLRK
jgi:XTP/dITP diphosphohydrolase